MPSHLLSRIIHRTGATPSTPTTSDPDITGVCGVSEAGPGDITFIADAAHLKELSACRATAVLISRKILRDIERHMPSAAGGGSPPLPIVLVVDEADLAMVVVLQMFAPPIPRPKGIHPSAVIDPTARLAPDVAVGPFCHVGARVTIGVGSVLHTHVVVQDDVTIGDGCELYPQVVVRERCTIGKRVVLNAGAVIGTDGFGYRWNGREHLKVPQIGTVVIGDDVEVGSNTCVDRAKFAATVIGSGTKIDNLAQIGHNVVTGPHCIIVGQVGLAGSVRLGTGVVIGGQAAVRDHVSIGDGAMVAACSGVWEDITPRQTVSGTPALPHRQSLREQAALRRLPDLLVLAKKIEEQLKSIQDRR